MFIFMKLIFPFYPDSYQLQLIYIKKATESLSTLWLFYYPTTTFTNLSGIAMTLRMVLSAK